MTVSRTVWGLATLKDDQMSGSGGRARLAAGLCLVTGLAGLLLNSTCGLLVRSEELLTVLVLSSLAMIATGFLPAVKQWPYSRVATGGMVVAITVYGVWVAIIVES